MTIPTIGEVGQYLLDEVQPLAWDDANRGYGTRILAGAFGAPFEAVQAIVSDAGIGYVPWEIVFDVDRCPLVGLPYLAQFVGVTLTPGMSEADQRSAIRSTGQFGRGSALSMAVAAARFLTGTRTVRVRVRYDGTGVDAPKNVQVLTRASETPDEASMRNAVLSVKPAGLAYDIRSVTGQTWQQVADNYATWADVAAHYATWNDVAIEPLA